MTIQPGMGLPGNPPPPRGTPAGATDAAGADRYVPSEEGTLPCRMGSPDDRLAVGQMLRQAGLSDAQGLVTWMATAHPPGTRLDDFARKVLEGVRGVTGDLKQGVQDFVRLAETSRRAELQDTPQNCLDHGLEALKLLYGPLQNDGSRGSQFRGLLGVLGNPDLTYKLLFEPLPDSEAAVSRSTRESAINQVVREIREHRKAAGNVPDTDEVLRMRDEAITSLAAQQ